MNRCSCDTLPKTILVDIIPGPMLIDKSIGRYNYSHEDTEECIGGCGYKITKTCIDIDLQVLYTGAFPATMYIHVCVKIWAALG